MFSIRHSSPAVIRLFGALCVTLLIGGCNMPRFGAPTPTPPLPTATPPPAPPATSVPPENDAPTAASAGTLPAAQHGPGSDASDECGEDHGGYAGEVVAAQRLVVQAAAAGRVVEVAVAEGAKVRAGDVLVRIDAAPLEARRAQALAALEAAQAQLDLLSTEVAADELEAAQAVTAAATAAYQQLTEEAGTEPDERSAGAAEVAAAYARLAQARAELARLERGPDPAQLAAARTQVELAATDLYLAQLQLDQAVLQAPMDAVVADVQTSLGAELAAGDPAVVLLSPDREVRFWVEESALPDLRIGRPVEIRLTAYPDEPLRGEVVRIAPELDAGTRMVEATAAPLGDTERLLPGMSAMVTLGEAAEPAP